MHFSYGLFDIPFDIYSFVILTKIMNCIWNNQKIVSKIAKINLNKFDEKDEIFRE